MIAREGSIETSTLPSARVFGMGHSRDAGRHEREEWQRTLDGGWTCECSRIFSKPGLTFCGEGGE